MHRECHMNTKVRDKTGADGVDEFDLEIFLQNNPKHSENFITVNLDSTRTTCTINKTMDNAAFETDTRGTNGTELRNVSVMVPGDSTPNIKLTEVTKYATNGSAPSTSMGTCHPAACMAARKKYLDQGPQSADQSPWHHRKTIYLIVVIAALIIWIVVYSTLNNYHLV